MMKSSKVRVSLPQGAQVNFFNWIEISAPSDTDLVIRPLRQVPGVFFNNLIASIEDAGGKVKYE
jgi:hypothetical protein